MRVVIQTIISAVVFVAAGCSTAVSPRHTALASSPQTAPAEPLYMGMLALESEAVSQPAKLKDEDYHRVSGEYTYKDLEAVLRIIGRIRGASREVTQVSFFKGIAAAVSVGHTSSWTEYLCSKDANGVWQIVGHRTYVS